jgi:hypothetical protein
MGAGSRKVGKHRLGLQVRSFVDIPEELFSGVVLVVKRGF